MYSGTGVAPSPQLLAQTVDGVTIAELTGELDLASAPDVREQFLNLLRPGSSRLVVDLSKVSFADASGLAVLVSTARRARLLGGFLHLAAVAPPVVHVLRITGLHLSFAIFRTVQDAATGQRSGLCSASGTRGDGARARPASIAATAPPVSTNAIELRKAVAMLLTGAEAWHNADPGGRFTPALGAMARACDGTDDTALYAAARALLSALARHPLTYSPAVVATATHLRQVLNPAPGSVPGRGPT